MDKLKPCPFCGSVAKLSSDDSDYVMCSNWDCHLNSGLAKAFPIEAWNTRNQPQEWQEPGDDTPDDALVWVLYNKGEKSQHWEAEVYYETEYFIGDTIVLAKENQGPPPNDCVPEPGQLKDEL